MDAEHLKTCARQTGFVVAPVNFIYLDGFWSVNSVISKMFWSTCLFFRVLSKAPFPNCSRAAAVCQAL